MFLLMMSDEVGDLCDRPVRQPHGHKVEDYESRSSSRFRCFDSKYLLVHVLLIEVLLSYISKVLALKSNDRSFI